MLRDHSWNDSGEFMRCWDSNLGQRRERQMLLIQLPLAQDTLY